MTIGVRDRLEALSFRAWPPFESTDDDGWLLRYAGGYSRRLNSATPGDDSVEGLDGRLESARRWYADRGLDLVVRLTSRMDEIDAALAARWFSRESPVDVMTRVDLPSGASDSGVRIGTEPGDDWFGFHHPLLGPDRRDLVEAWRRILAAVDPATGFGLVEADDRVVGAGFAVADQGWVGLFQLAVHPAYRRRGIGRRLSESLLAWGSGHDATQAYLQVEQANRVGVGLYRSLAFRPAYTSGYRRERR